ncbi:MAG: WYL domain-containing protein [Muribaculaceae bacterium]|nr:WYL domain-containing protein [Muribaculaceae bacterium]
MTQTEKYIWVIDTIYRAKQLSLSELSARWRADMGLRPDDKINRSTFTRWREDIYSQFGVVISCKRPGGYKYFIENPEIIEENKVNKWMLDTIATGNLINSNISVSNRILVTSIPSGNEHLKSIIDALKTNTRIEITYRQFDRESFTYTVDPYCVKLFENRWYVLARNNRNSMRLYCLDRILDVAPCNEHFDLPEDFDAEEYFAPYYGVVTGEEPERIVIRAYDVHRHYMASLPLHFSQELIEDTGEYSDFQLYVAPTYDLVMKLLSFGSMIEVLRPESLRETMRGWASDLHQMYKLERK